MTHIQPKVELFYGGQWHDETGHVQQNTTIGIRRGIHSEGSQADPTWAGLTFRNEDRRFSRTHPNSALYRQIGRANPLRVYLGTPHVGAADGDDADTTSHVAPSVDAPAPGLLICAWAAPQPGQSYTVPLSMTASTDNGDSRATIQGAREVIAAAGPTGTRTATFSASESWIAGSVLVPGPTSITTGTVAFADGNAQVDGQPGDWWVLHVALVWNVFDEPTHLFPWDTDGGGWLPLGDSGTVGPFDDTHATFITMRVFAKKVKTASAAHTVTVPFEGSVLGHLTRVPAAEVDDWDPRATVLTSGMPPRQDLSGNHHVVPVRAAGMLEQLGGTRNEPVASAMRRWLSRKSNTVVAYAPCEDGKGASQLASGLPGGRLGRPIGDVDMAADSDWFGSLPLPVLGNAGRLNVRVPFHATGEEHAVAFLAFPDDGMTNDTSVLTLNLHGGQVDRFNLYYGGGGTLGLRAQDADGVDLDDTGGVAFAVDGERTFIRIMMRQNGSDIDVSITKWAIDPDGLDATASSFGDTFAGLTMTRSRLLIAGSGSAGEGLSAGHLAVATSDLVTLGVDRAVIGQATEPAGERAYRLCRDADVPIEIIGDPADTVTMGPQPVASLLDLLRECEEADRGILFEPRGFFGLAYRTGRSLYNQQAVATLDGAAGEIAPPWEPEPDNFLVQNDVTVVRTGGSSSRSVQESGPLNVGDPADDVDAVGPRPTAPTINVGHDLTTADLAQWLRHLGTVDEPRYPVVAVDLVREQVLSQNPMLVAALSRLDIGDRLVITNPPADLPPDDISVLVVGIDEPQLDGFRRRLEIVAVPESPYHIAEVEHDDYDILQSDSATLDEALDTTETAVDIDCGAGPDWVHEVDFDLLIGGERVTVTAVAAMTGTFPNRKTTLTVTRSVNGVVKSHSAGDPVEFFHKSYIGL